MGWLLWFLSSLGSQSDRESGNQRLQQDGYGMRDFLEKMLRGLGRGDKGSRSCSKHPRGAGAHCVPTDTVGQDRAVHEFAHGDQDLLGPGLGWIIKRNHCSQNPWHP